MLVTDAQLSADVMATAKRLGRPMVPPESAQSQSVPPTDGFGAPSTSPETQPQGLSNVVHAMTTPPETRSQGAYDGVDALNSVLKDAAPLLQSQP